MVGKSLLSLKNGHWSTARGNKKTGLRTIFESRGKRPSKVAWYIYGTCEGGRRHTSLDAEILVKLRASHSARGFASKLPISPEWASSSIALNTTDEKDKEEKDEEEETEKTEPSAPTSLVRQTAPKRSPWPSAWSRAGPGPTAATRRNTKDCTRRCGSEPRTSPSRRIPRRARPGSSRSYCCYSMARTRNSTQLREIHIIKEGTPSGASGWSPWSRRLEGRACQ